MNIWHFETLSQSIIEASVRAGKISSYAILLLGLSGTMNITAKHAKVFVLYTEVHAHTNKRKRTSKHLQL